MKYILLLRLIKESAAFAIGAIVANKLRTFLSLLGITIGIFAIISVFTMIDSLERNIRGSIASLGEDVLFVQKWPWEFGKDFAWWKYINRPEVDLAELKELQKRVPHAQCCTFMVVVNKTVEYQDNYMEGVGINGASSDYDKVKNFDIAKGRYITEAEFASGTNIAVIGSDIAETLFGNEDPIGKRIIIMDKKFEVIGIFKKEGANTFNNSSDRQVLLPINTFRRMINLKGKFIQPIIMVKAMPNISNEELRWELTGAMRSIRKLKPVAEDNFAINETSLISKGFDSLFSVISIAGWVIGGFSILVGGFGIANIMFVSVKERTAIIGIQKSLGAKNYFILYQFLFEAVLLSILGGIVGLLLIYSGTLVLQNMMDFPIVLSIGNVIKGLSISAIIGLISGFIPAWNASRLDPVEAMRSTN